MPQDSLCNASVAVHKTAAFCIPALRQETSQEAGLVRSFLPKPKPHAKLLLQPTAVMDRAGGRRANRAPVHTGPSEEPKPSGAARREPCACPGRAPVNTCAPWSSPEERASPGGSHTQIQPLDCRETHFPSSVPTPARMNGHTKKNISVLPSPLQAASQRRRAHTPPNTLGVRTALGGGNPENESTLPHR